MPQRPKRLAGSAFWRARRSRRVIRARLAASNKRQITGFKSLSLKPLPPRSGTQQASALCSPGTGKPPASRRRVQQLCERQGPGSTSDFSAVDAATQKKNNHEPDARRSKDSAGSGSCPITTPGLRPGRHRDRGARPTHEPTDGRDLPARRNCGTADEGCGSRDRPDDAGDRP